MINVIISIGILDKAKSPDLLPTDIRRAVKKIFVYLL